MSSPRYERYRESGVEWLGEVPEHWSVRRIKLVAEVFPSSVDKKEYPDEIPVRLCNYTDVYYNDVISTDMPLMQATASPEQVAKFTLRRGDTIITKDSETADDIAISAYVPKDMPGVVCGYHLSIARPRDGVSGAFLKRAFDTHSVRAQAEVSANGLTRVGLSQSAIDNLLIPVPDYEEQFQIDSFIGQETAKIDALIEEQRRLIALLKEKRQAVISHAVTKGLNPVAPMKDSGLEWIGEVPQHWRVGRIGRHIQVIPGFAFPSADFSHDSIDTRLLRGINVGVGCVRWDETVYWKRSPSDELDPFELRLGDVVLGMDRPLIGEGVRVAKISEADLPCLLLQRVALLRTDADLNSNFLMRLLSSEMFVAHFSPETSGVSVPHISPEQIRAFVIPLPGIDEQNAIVEFVEREAEHCDDLTEHCQRAIALLQERRSALISAAVTGKIDVRNSSPRETPSHEEVYEPA